MEILWGGSPINKPKGVGPGSCTGSAKAGAGKSNGDARRIHPHLGERGAGAGGDETNSTLRTEYGLSAARFRRAFESREKAMQALQKAQEIFEQAQQEMMQAQTDLQMLMQEAPLPVMPVPQVNVSLAKSLEALTGIMENLWNPDAGPPPDNPTHAIQESRQILQTSSVILSQEGGAALDAELDAGQDSRALGSGRRRSRGDGRLLQVSRRCKRQCEGHARMQRGIHR